MHKPTPKKEVKPVIVMIAENLLTGELEQYPAQVPDEMVPVLWAHAKKGKLKYMDQRVYERAPKHMIDLLFALGLAKAVDSDKLAAMLGVPKEALADILALAVEEEKEG